MAKKKKGLSELKSQPAQKKKSINPFEIHINRQKFNVLGRELKADRGLPGVARAKAVKKRKETLLQEYKVLHKSNKFYDRRIGEKNSAMTKEDRIIARFSAERMKAHTRKNIFNLADDEVLTHKGQSIAEIEKFDDPLTDDDEPDMKGLDANFVEEANFGGGTLKESKNNRAAIIEQLITESKKRKAERQLAKERTLQKTEELDAEWKELIPIVNMGKYDVDVEKKDSYDKILNELKFEPRGTPSDKLKSEAEIAEEEAQRLRELEEERLRRMRGEETTEKLKVQHRSADDLDDGLEIEEENFELAYDQEGNPLGLEKLEGIKSDQHNEEKDSEASGSEEEEEEDDDDEEEDDAGEGGEEEENGEGNRKIEGCDETIEEKNEGMIQEDNESSDAESDDLSDLKVKNDDDKNDSDNEAEEAEDKSQLTIEKGEQMLLDNSDGIIKQEKDLTTCNKSNSFVMEVDNKNENDQREKNLNASDSSLNEVCKKDEMKQKEKKKVSFNREVKLLTFGSQINISNKSTEEIEKEKEERKLQMERARKELPYAFEAPENDEELQILLKNRSVEHQAVIVERIIKCNHPSLNEKNKSKMENLFAFLMQHINDVDYPEAWSVLDRLAPFLFDLTQFSPSNAAYCLNEVILEKHSDFLKKKHKYPLPDTLIFLKLVPLLFPTSDKRHCVTTPSYVFILEMLHQCAVTTRRAIATGLFLVALLTEYLWLSKRVVPEALNFLCGIIHMASPVTSLQVVPPFKKEHKFLFLHKSLAEQKDLNLSMRGSDLGQKAPKIDDEFRVRSVYSALKLLHKFAELYDEIPASKLLFQPIKKHLDGLEIDKYPDSVKEAFNNLNEDLSVLLKKELNPVIMEAKKPKALRLYEPVIKPVYDSKKKNLPPEQAEHMKLTHKYKKEMKGALREIRRDREFISKLKFKEQATSDAERKRKVKEIYSWGAQQQSEFKKLKRKKK